MQEKEVKQKAAEYIKNNKDELIKKFAPEDEYPPEENPISIFMAGCFGAGKTEFTNRYRQKVRDLVLIDADEVRNLCPNYNGEKAYLFNYASSIGVSVLHNYVLKNDISFIFDGSFRSDKSIQNIQRSTKRDRPATIIYVHQDPKIAWLFTQIRAEITGRHISKDAFISSVYKPKENIAKIKEKFGDKVNITLVEKDLDKKLSDIDINIKEATNEELEELKNLITYKDIRDIKDIDKEIEFEYTKEELKQSL
ncbi:MAG: zeta toxin family protein [Candidatus Magasanikbacteria bacterium]